jgi:hypothetical protein
MKTLFLILFILIGVKAKATYWLTYYIYTETEYSQGPWKNAKTTDLYHSMYLAAKPHEELFGTVENQFLNQVLSDLRKEKPRLYSQDISVDSKKDTVTVRIKGNTPNKASIFNEMTATYTANGYSVVQFDINDTMYTKTWNDLTLPYMDLVELNGADTLLSLHEKEPVSDSSNTDKELTQAKETRKNDRLTWYTKISIGLNILLILYLLFKNKIHRNVTD